MSDDKKELPINFKPDTKFAVRIRAEKPLVKPLDPQALKEAQRKTKPAGFEIG